MTSVERSSGDQVITAYLVSAVWGEKTLTSTPGYGLALTNLSSSVFSNNAWANFSLPAATCQAWLTNPVSNCGVMLKTATDDPGYSGTYPYRLRAYFASKEDPSASIHPKLVINYTPPALSNVCPLVGIASPNDNALYAPGAGVPIIVNASDPDGTVTNVNIYAGSTLLGQYTNVPCTNVWYTWITGSTSLTAVAYDNAGGCSTSAAVTVRTRSTVYSADMTTNPVWTLGGSWGYGKPAGAGPAANGGGYPDPSLGYTGTNVIGYLLSGCFSTLGADVYAAMPAVDCSAYTNVSLEFYAWLGVFYDSNQARVEISTDNVTWTRIWYNTSGYSGAGWWFANLDISSYASGKPTVYIRWVQGAVNYSGYNFCGWNIDDVRVTGTLPVFSVTPLIASVSGTNATGFVISRDKSVGDVAVNYTVGGTARLGPSYDYTMKPTPDSYTGSAIMSNGVASVTVAVLPQFVATPSPDRTVTLALSCPAGSLLSGNSNAVITLLGQGGGTGTVSVAMGASAIGMRSATLNASVLSTQACTEVVSAVWGTTDAGTNSAAWSNGVNFTSQVISGLVPFATNVTGLIPDTVYRYRYFMSNTVGGVVVWASTGMAFRTSGQAYIDNSQGATDIHDGLATLRFVTMQMFGLGGTGTVYWGSSDGGTNTGAWSNSCAVVVPGDGYYSRTVSGLVNNVTTFYRCSISNSGGTVWAPATTSFVARSSQYWDTSDTAGLQGGSGTWDTGSTVMWSDTADGSGSRTTWSGLGTAARFNVAGGGVVTVSGAVQADNLAFNASGYVLTNGTITLTGSNGLIAANSDALIASKLAGTVGLTKAGNGTLALRGTNSYTGGIIISAGCLDGNTLSLTGTVANAGALVFNQASTGSYVSQISGTGTVSKVGSGALTLSSANNFSGDLTLGAGTLTAGTSTSFGSGRLLLATGTVTAVGLTITNPMVVSGDIGLNGGTFTGPVNLSGAIRMLTLGADAVISGVVSNGGLNKAGASMLTLSVTNTYTNVTVVSGGTLALGASGDIAKSAAINLGTGIVLDVTAKGGFAVATNQTLCGFGSVTGNVAVAVGGTLMPGTNGVAGALTFQNSLNMQSGSVFRVNQYVSGTNGQAIVYGNLSLSNSVLSITGTGDSYYLLIDNRGTNPVAGTFAGLPELAPVTVGSATRYITYKGGDGNDVELRSIQVTNIAASAVTMNSATLQGRVQYVGGSCDVLVYWGTSDGATNAAWAHTNAVGSCSNVAITNVAFNTGSVLSPGVKYYYAFRATNATANIWAQPSASVISLCTPVVGNAGGATNQAAASATLQGVLTTGGMANGWICWGRNDGGISTTSAWDQVQAVGVVNQGVVFTAPATGLVANVTYFYRCYATNLAGQGWSASASTFGATPAGNVGPVAATNSGGTVTNYTLNGTNFTAHIFTNNGTFVVTNGGSVEVLVVAGGGGGGPATDRTGGGGGAGGLIYTPAYSLSSGTYTVTVGAGGTNGVNGGNSQFGSDLVAAGGGHGGSLGVSTGNGGSGGGAYHNAASLNGTGTAGQGNNGGIGYDSGSSTFGGGGGGGAGSAGTNAVVSCAGGGGAGLSYNLGGTPVWYAGGGGGGQQNLSGQGYPPGLGGIGGGGNGYTNGNGFAGTAGTGGGGGGAGNSGIGGTGGSGIVIVRYSSVGPALQNLAPTGISSNSATLNAVLSAPNTNYVVTVYWGATDGGTNVGAWNYSASVGSWTNVASTNIMYQTNGLSAATTYYYAFRATNATTKVWAQPSWQFATIGQGVPVVASQGASPSGYTSATLSGLLTSGISADAWICWGSRDGGTSGPGNWDHAVYIGPVGRNLPFSASVTGLSTNATYFFRCFVTNAAGQDWSDSASSFSATPASGYSGFAATNSGGTVTNYTLNGTNYVAHIFTNTACTGTLFFASSGNVEVLVVGGGGAGGWNGGGGGGAGGYIYSNAYPVVSGSNYTVVVGGGGAVPTGAAGGNGTNSVFGTLTAIGGGGGGGRDGNSAPTSGGSGGGSSASATSGTWTNGGVGIAGQGNNGGSGVYNGGAAATSGGGGGAGGAGTNATTSLCGGGGIGIANSISGVLTYYAGGGGGGGIPATGGQNGAAGGAGGGGNGGNGSPATNAGNGAPNTGGGGGGMGANPGAGGSGIVIVRYVSIGCVIQNLAPSGITSNAASLNSALSASFTNYTVTAYWGTTNGGTNAGAWTYCAAVGSWTNVASTNISYQTNGLSAATTYYYAFRATNAKTNVWAQPSWQFTTFGATVSNSVDAYGIPDSWKNIYCLSGTNWDGLADPDGDGMNNLEEYLAGTDPTNAASVLAMENVVKPGGNKFVVSWQSVYTKFYSVQRSTNLLDNWSIIQSNLPATAPLNVYTDTPPASVKGIFYRVNVE